ncbi:hypothetical protein RJT34_31579 [Clitoria ternatea]|uniref:Uncharacterized protein n=1 Tax=Clitoria ternatea TaxID=43366 RepID=A0AAN9I3Q1_CLITE
MADSVVSFVLQHVSQLLAHEASLLCGVEDRIKSLHNELEMINVFLQASNSQKEMEQKVTSQIRDVIHVAEDVIDTFVTKVAMHNRRNMLGRMLHGVVHARLLRDVAQKIDKIKASINEIHENKTKYEDFQESTTLRDEEDEERAESLHKRRRNVEEEDVVGFVHDSKLVIKRLMEGGSQRSIVSIIGMGGLGKTTLARMVYNSSEVKQHFTCQTWVYVSNECRSRELLLGLLKQLMPSLEYVSGSNKKKGKKHQPGDISRLSEDELKEMVRGCLKRKRYLLVLDDLWKTQDWDKVQNAFPDDNRGSRILVTSRLKEVALHTSHDPPYCLQFLGEEESWELFWRKVFRGENCPSELEPLGKELVKSCHGLPLSIVVLAGLLANKEKSLREWSKVAGHVNWYLTQNETQVKDIVLKLSYDNLPRRLKPCFLYLGIFPEDFEIPVRPLLERWVAEGFILETGSRDPDDVAEDYLYELIDRSLIQVARVKTNGGVKRCRIHDLLRDLCIFESKKDKLFEVCTDNNILIPTKPRRLSIHCSLGIYISSSNNDHSCDRSLFCFGPFCYFQHGEWRKILKCFKLVRVLELGWNSCGAKIPSNLGDFIHLRYLRIDSKFVRIIPDSIINLQNLQTFDLGHYRMLIPVSFPCGIWKLKHLRHVYSQGPIMLRGHCSGPHDVMWNLKTIFGIELNRKTSSMIENGKFPMLKKLGLQLSSECKQRFPELLLRLQQLSHLNKLKIVIQLNYRFTDHSISYLKNMECNIGCKPLELLQSLKFLSHLTQLKIVNALDLLTCVGAFPPNITKLTLENIASLNDDGIIALGNLTKLQFLRLSGHVFGGENSFDLNCVAGGFPQLRVFQMRDLQVQSWKLASSAMLCLQSLVIDGCSKLDGLPNELWSLTDLRKVQVERPSEAMARLLRNLEINNKKWGNNYLTRLELLVAVYSSRKQDPAVACVVLFLSRGFVKERNG